MSHFLVLVDWASFFYPLSLPAVTRWLWGYWGRFVSSKRENQFSRVRSSEWNGLLTIEASILLSSFQVVQGRSLSESGRCMFLATSCSHTELLKISAEKRFLLCDIWLSGPTSFSAPLMSLPPRLFVCLVFSPFQSLLLLHSVYILFSCYLYCNVLQWKRVLEPIVGKLLCFLNCT